MKAKQMQAQFDAQNSQKRTHSSARRGMLTGLAAAAAVLIGGTVTVGALNDWNYMAVFSKYFSDKSGEDINFDFSGMGLDIGEVIEGDGFTMTIQAVLADTNAVYVARDITLSDELNAQIAPYENVNVSAYMKTQIVHENGDGTFETIAAGGQDVYAAQTADKVWHCMTIVEMPFATDLTGNQIRISSFGDQYSVNVNYFSPEKGDAYESIDLYAPKTEYTYDLSDITVQYGLSLPYNRALPNDENQNIFETLTVTPFVLRFEKALPSSVLDEMGLFPEVKYDLINPPVYTAVYADGTERTLQFISTGGGGMDGEDDSTVYMIETRYLASPLDLNGLTAIRIDDIEIPIQ